MEVGFYGLTNDPFPLEPGSGSYFQSAAHQQALSFVGDYLGRPDTTIVLSGESGTGKSMLVSHLLKTMDRNKIVVGKVNAGQAVNHSLYELFATAFSVHCHDEDDRQCAALMQRLWQSQSVADKSFLLVVDDAHNLAEKDMVELLQLSSCQLQILLIGQVSLPKRLQTHAEILDHNHVCHQLGGLDMPEVRDFFVHRLLCAGWNGDSPALDPRVFIEIARASEGVPAQVNLISHQVWQFCRDLKCPRIEPEAVREVLSGHNWKYPEPRPGVAYLTRSSTFAVQEELMVELQRAAAELAALQSRRSNAADLFRELPTCSTLQGIFERLSKLEAQALEQEQALKHIVTVLIEWIETGAQRTAA